MQSTKKNTLIKDFIVIIPDTVESSKLLKYADNLGWQLLLIMDKKWINSTYMSDGWKQVLVDDMDNHESILSELVSFFSNKNCLAVLNFSERNVILASKIRQLLGLNGLQYPHAEKFRDKLQMKIHARETGVQIPDFSSLAEVMIHECSWDINKKCVLKPRYGWACSGVRVFENLRQLKEWVVKSDLNYKDYMVEEYIAGKLIHVGGIVGKKSCVYKIILDHRTPIYDVTQNSCENHVYFSVNQESSNAKRLLSLSEQILLKFGLSNSFFEIELLEDQSTHIPYLCEIAARPATGRSAYAHEYLVGKCPYEILADLLNDLVKSDISKKTYYSWNNNYVGMLNFVGERGTVRELTSINDITHVNIISAEQKMTVGTVFKEKNFDNSLARFFVRGSSQEECLNVISHIEKEFKYTIES